MSSEQAELTRVYIYLLLGQEGNCYASGVQQNNNQEKPEFIDNLLSEGKGPQIIEEIQKFQTCLELDHVAKLFILAQCARSTDGKTKIAVQEALPSICETGEDIMTFVLFTEQLSKIKGTTGWGRAQRSAISKWYNDKVPLQLAVTCTKFSSHHGWTHRDVLRLGHVKTANKATAAVLKFLNKGMEETEKEFEVADAPEDVTEVLTYLKAVHKLKHTRDEHEAIGLIEKHSLPIEIIPTLLRKLPEIWRTLLPVTPLSKILAHLRRFAQLGFLTSSNPVLPILLDQLHDLDKLAASKLHPVNIFLALKKYEEFGRATSTSTTGRPTKRRLTTSVIDALHNMFVTSLKHVSPTGKRFFIVVDVRNPMVHSKVQGCPQLTPALASALIILPLLQAESAVTVAAFSTNDLRVLDLKKDMALLDVTKRMRETPMGPVNCAKPMLWAKQANKPFDVFLVLTDNQIKPVDVKPCDALHQYRKAMHLPKSRLIFCALTLKRFSVAAQDLGSGMLDIGGFDANVPQIIRSFTLAPL